MERRTRACPPPSGGERRGRPRRAPSTSSARGAPPPAARTRRHQAQTHAQILSLLTAHRRRRRGRHDPAHLRAQIPLHPSPIPNPSARAVAQLDDCGGGGLHLRRGGKATGGAAGFIYGETTGGGELDHEGRHQCDGSPVASVVSTLTEGPDTRCRHLGIPTPVLEGRHRYPPHQLPLHRLLPCQLLSFPVLSSQWQVDRWKQT